MILELCDNFRRCKRILDSYMSTRKAFLLVLVVFGLLLYIGPSVFRWLRKQTPIMIDPSVGCVSFNMNALVHEALNFDASVFRSYEVDDQLFLPYVGNGRVGLPIVGDERLYIHYKRSLSVPVAYHPIVQVDIPGASSQEGLSVQYKNGIAYKFQCFNMRRHAVSVIHQFYAYRAVPSLLIQQIEITNPLNEELTLMLRQESASDDHFPLVITLPNGNRFEYRVFSDEVRVPGTSESIVLSIAAAKVPPTITVAPKSSKKLVIRTSVHYSEASSTPKSESLKQKLESQSQMDLRNALDADPLYLRMKHVEAWRKVWRSGFSISVSRAQGALNGDRINATLYYVLSHSRDYLSESDTTPQQRLSYHGYLYMPDKCYSGHPTLQASTLWSADLGSVGGVNRVVDLWLLTLNKQGCHHLLMAGAEGVVQAMVLSLGGFKFSLHHLEYDTEPRHLHRDYAFRRIAYGNATHLNVSVRVQEDNRAAILAALDRSDREYYACDGGCLDPPVKLGSRPVQLPVKLTRPVTAVLYITADRQHMEELKHTIHVTEVVQAPAHEHHVIALHRHGHRLGGLPAFFWVSIAFLIAVFHLFLAKLIYNEYCGGAERAAMRSRYVA